MCDCKNRIPKEIYTEEITMPNHIQRWGYSMIRIAPYRKDGKPSKVFKYMSAKWHNCPFCGQGID